MTIKSFSIFWQKNSDLYNPLFPNDACLGKFLLVFQVLKRAYIEKGVAGRHSLFHSWLAETL